MINYKGYFISLEGGEGVGKTEQMERLKTSLRGLGYEVVLTREPGGVKLAEEIRNVLLNPKVKSMDAMTEVLLYAASRREHLTSVILPALEDGKVVISDRYIDSSLVYQGLVKGVGLDQVLNINLAATDNILPDLTLLFDAEPEIALSRIDGNQREVNRFDKEPLEFHQMVRSAYYSLAVSTFNDRFEIVDANKSIDDVFERSFNIIEERLDRRYQKMPKYTLTCDALTIGADHISNNSISFHGNGNLVLEFTADGELYWRGRKVETDKELVESFRDVVAQNFK